MSPYTFAWFTELNCSQTETPINGWKSDEATVVNTTVIFGCNKGYILHGETLLKCLANQMWNGSVPTCQGIGFATSQVLTVSHAWHG